ncbi:hypothetical protein BC826DRAFT_176584 [Russula brevipes]|nr:hypothetical protein BC826DRAFT_176584 [Russula brevipes]
MGNQKRPPEGSSLHWPPNSETGNHTVKASQPFKAVCGTNCRHGCTFLMGQVANKCHCQRPAYMEPLNPIRSLHYPHLSAPRQSRSAYRPSNFIQPPRVFFFVPAAHLVLDDHHWRCFGTTPIRSSKGVSMNFWNTSTSIQNTKFCGLCCSAWPSHMEGKKGNAKIVRGATAVMRRFATHSRCVRCFQS